MKYTLHFTLLLITFLLFSCNSSKETTETNTPINKTADVKTTGNRVIISAPVVPKPFVKKNGNATDIMEYYVSRSIQDYFIKFCESEVTFQDLEKVMYHEDESLNTLKLEVEFKNGEWDSCDELNRVQSRTGEYVVIYRILN